MDTVDTNIQLIRRYWDEIWSAGRIDLISELYHPNCLHGDDFTIEGFERNVRVTREALPDFRVEIHDLFGVGERVVSRITYHGTHTGAPYAGIAPSGATVEAGGIDIFHIREGKIAEHWHEADHYTIFQQLGMKYVKPDAG